MLTLWLGSRSKFTSGPCTNVYCVWNWKYSLLGWPCNIRTTKPKPQDILRILQTIGGPVISYFVVLPYPVIKFWKVNAKHCTWMSTKIHNTDGGPYCVQVLFTLPEYLYMNDKIHRFHSTTYHKLLNQHLPISLTQYGIIPNWRYMYIMQCSTIAEIGGASEWLFILTGASCALTYTLASLLRQLVNYHIF